MEFDGGGPELFATYFTLHCSRPTRFRKGIMLTLTSVGLWQQIKDTFSVIMPYDEKRMKIKLFGQVAVVMGGGDTLFLPLAKPEDLNLAII